MNPLLETIRKVVCWIFKKPILSQDELKVLYIKTHEDTFLHYFIAGCSWIFSMLLFVSIGISSCFYSIGIFFESEAPFEPNWLQSGSSPIIVFVGILMIIISIFIGSCIASIVWFYIMKAIKIINNSSIELIIRNGPFIRKKLNKKNRIES